MAVGRVKMTAMLGLKRLGWLFTVLHDISPSCFQPWEICAFLKVYFQIFLSHLSYKRGAEYSAPFPILAI